MRVHLLFNDKDYEELTRFPKESETLAADLDLDTIVGAMSDSDDNVEKVCRTIMFTPLNDEERINYRKEVLKDVFDNYESVKRLYEITIETEDRRRQSRAIFPSVYLSSTFSSAIELLKIYVDELMVMRKFTDSVKHAYKSEGFTKLFNAIHEELPDDYFKKIKAEFDEMSDTDGLLVSAGFGSNLTGTGYMLRKKNYKSQWLYWMRTPSYSIEEQDDESQREIARREELAINDATNALAQATDSLKHFFEVLRDELSFYIGCLNLSDKLKSISMPVCIPTMINNSARSFEGLYNISLAVKSGQNIVGNDYKENDKKLLIITGANQGGKTVFLQAMGQAQIMAQCGMPVGASKFEAPVKQGILTHFLREEDRSMHSGKLDEELVRMSSIVDKIRPGFLILMNESFASTNEREGSEICSQITKAFIDRSIEVMAVTHLYTYAAAFLKDPRAAFLRAERLNDGSRTFKIVQGEPLSTVYGEDIYKKIFGENEEKDINTDNKQ